MVRAIVHLRGAPPTMCQRTYVPSNGRGEEKTREEVGLGGTQGARALCGPGPCREQQLQKASPSCPGHDDYGGLDGRRAPGFRPANL